MYLGRLVESVQINMHVFNSKCLCERFVLSQIAHPAGGSFQFNSKTGCKQLFLKQIKNEVRTCFGFGKVCVKTYPNYTIHHARQQEYLLPNSTASIYVYLLFCILVAEGIHKDFFCSSMLK